MTAKIKQIFTSPEGKTLEFKRDLSSPWPMLKTLVAFANTAGGRLLIGIEDDSREVLGVEYPLDEEERICNLIADNIEPRLVPNVDLIEQWGSGVRRMFREAEALGLSQPEIIEVGMRVRFIVYLEKSIVLPTESYLGKNKAGTQSPTQSSTQSPTQSVEPIQRLLLALTDEEKSSSALRSILGIKHRPTFRDNYLHPAVDAELIEMTIPEKPSSSKQKYRLTDRGKVFLAKEDQP